jgi:UDP-glucuronate 4-epimerase
MSSILITGGAGFIGYHLQQQLQHKHHVTGIDLLVQPSPAVNLRSKQLKQISHSSIHDNFIDTMEVKPDVVMHLAAETGIAGSLHHPQRYYETNVSGTFNVLEQCRKNGVKYLIYASSSSVYAPNQAVMREDSDTGRQLSFYGTTKKMTEVMIENYCAQFGITAIGLRFFTVYGSFTRPDMAAYKFMQAIEEGNKIILYNTGQVMRDFTHVSDIVKSIELITHKIVTEKPATHRIFNIGFGQPASVLHYAELIAELMNKPISLDFKPLPPNELLSTHSNSDKLFRYIDYRPQVTLHEGIKEMTDWFKGTKYV